MSDTEDPSLTGLLQRIRARATQEVRILLPARVERFDADRQCVDAQPWIQREVTLEDGSTAIERLPVVTNAPVMFPRSGDYAITFPVAVGSTVVLHFTSASLDRWLAIGGEVAPGDARKLTLNDAFAVPGGHSFAGSTAPSTSAPTISMVLHGDRVDVGGTCDTNPLTGEGVVVASGIDPFTGASYGTLGNASTRVFAKKV